MSKEDSFTSKFLRKLAVSGAATAEAGSTENQTEGVKVDQLQSPKEGLESPIAAGVVDGNVGGNDGHTLPGGNSNAADTNNAPAKSGLEASDVPTNEDPENKEAQDLKNAKENIVKTACAISAQSRQIAGLGVTNPSIKNAMQKIASGEASEIECMQAMNEYISKRASAGDPFFEHLVACGEAYQAGLQKKAADIDEMVKSGKVGSPEEADALLTQAAMDNPEAALADGGYIEPSEVPAEGAEMTEGEAAPAAVTEGEAPEAGEAAMSDEDLAAAASAALEQKAGELEAEVAQTLMQEHPELSPEQAQEAAAQIVADVVETVITQQTLGAQDDSGTYMVPDEEASAAVDEMQKSASAYPNRDLLVPIFNARLGLDVESFKKRFVK